MFRTALTIIIDTFRDHIMKSHVLAVFVPSRHINVVLAACHSATNITLRPWNVWFSFSSSYKTFKVVDRTLTYPVYLFGFHALYFWYLFFIVYRIWGRRSLEMQHVLDVVKRILSFLSWPKCFLCPALSPVSWTKLLSSAWPSATYTWDTLPTKETHHGAHYLREKVIATKVSTAQTYDWQFVDVILMIV